MPLETDEESSAVTSQETVTEALTVVPVLEDTELSISEWAFIGFGAAGIALITSLGVGVILRIFKFSS